MEFKEVLLTRRSVRSFSDKPVSSELVRDLLKLAVEAPSSQGKEPWLFGIVQDAELLSEISEGTKAFMLDRIQSVPDLEVYRGFFTDPTTDIFYHGKTLVMILASQDSRSADVDCALAASGLMLSAREKGIGSCWMGFGQIYCNQPSVKEKLGIDQGLKIVAPIILGYPAVEFTTKERKDPKILFWKE